METVEALQDQARVIGDKIGAIEDAKRREANTSKVGKNYRTRNSYSCPEKPSNYWWVYAKVTRMDKHGMLFTREFQTDKNGDITIRFDHYAYHMQGWSQIPESDFNRAWARMLAKVKTIPDAVDHRNKARA